jgi:ankyrin repeat protein
MFRLFLYLSLFLNTENLLAINVDHSRPSDEANQHKRFKPMDSLNPLDFKETLHLLCAQGHFEDIKAMLAITKAKKIDLVDGPSAKTALDYLIDYYIDRNFLLLIDSNQGVEFNYQSFSDVFKEFIRKCASITSSHLICLDPQILFELEDFTQHLIRNEFVNWEEKAHKTLLKLHDILINIKQALKINNFKNNTSKKVIKNPLNETIKKLIKSPNKDQKTTAADLIDVGISLGYDPSVLLEDKSNFDSLFFSRDIEALLSRRNLLIKMIVNEMNQKYQPIAYLEFKEINSPNKTLRLLTETLLDKHLKSIIKHPFICIRDRRNDSEIKTSWLHVSAKINDDKMVKFILESNCINVDTLNNRNQTAFNLAMYEHYCIILRNEAIGHENELIKNYNIIKLFILHNADVNKRDGISGDTPIEQALTIDVAKLLVDKKAHINNENTGAPVFNALGMHDLDLLIFWHESGIDFKRLFDKTTMQGLIVWFCCMKQGKFFKNAEDTNTIIKPDENDLKDLDIIKTLISCGVELNTIDSAGKTALCYAITRRQFHIVKLLIEKGEKPNQNHLDLALEDHGYGGRSHRNITKLLLNAGISSTHQVVLEVINQRELFFNALKNSDIEAVKELLDKGAGIFLMAKINGVLFLDSLDTPLDAEMISLLEPYLPPQPMKSSRHVSN